MTPEFTVSPALEAYMRKQKKMNIVVDVATSNTSDFEVSEIFLRLANGDQAEYLKTAKRFRARTWSGGEVLLPPYRLAYEERVRFDMKKYWFYHHLTAEGIHL